MGIAIIRALTVLNAVSQYRIGGLLIQTPNGWWNERILITMFSSDKRVDHVKSCQESRISGLYGRYIDQATDELRSPELAGKRVETTGQGLTCSPYREGDKMEILDCEYRYTQAIAMLQAAADACHGKRRKKG